MTNHLDLASHEQEAPMDLVPTSADSFQGQFISRENPPFELIKSWVAQCSQWHGTKCDSLVMESQSPPWNILDLRMIDVEQACLVRTPEPCEYVTLSYVWGAIPFLVATKENIEELERPGKLKALATEIPGTIRDAIDLVRMIGYRFLWVDRLCIVQDDKVNVQAHIWTMDQIYGYATLSIIAADGDNADAGLSRVRSSTMGRRRATSPFELTPRDGMVNDLNTLLNASAYRRRAWTFQEEFFSRKKLIFIDDEVFFECRNTMWREVETSGVKMTMCDSLDHRRLRTDICSQYHQIVNDFAKRQLTFPLDAMNAFAGVSNYFAELFGARMKLGLPNSVFDWAILWRPQGQVKQRQLRDSSFPSWSWIGWMGNIEIPQPNNVISADADKTIQRWLADHTWIVWYQWSPSLVALLWSVNDERNQQVREKYASVGYRCSNTIDPFGRRNQRFLVEGKLWDHASIPFADTELLSHPDLRTSPQSTSGQLLLFWTISAKFSLRSEEDLPGNKGFQYFHGSSKEDVEPKIHGGWSILDRWGIVCGYIIPNGGTDAMQREIHNDTRTHEVIALSDAKSNPEGIAMYEQQVQAASARIIPEHEDRQVTKYAQSQDVVDTNMDDKAGSSSEWDLYNIMLISWDGPIAKRKGIGKILNRAMWNGLDPGPIWKPILLG
ncbi:MAG: hypothetical protein L6R41_008409 [Letrouitia leprolyta]|nr:MAG: hypothetical protein L6R41_008409 [Letrouitia leprolyta]